MKKEGLCECGCGQRAPISERTDRKYGWVKGRPKRFILGHARRRDIPDYFVVDQGYKTPCWIWNRGTAKSGYGQTGRGPNAHREVYERFFGPVPTGLELDHLCRVRCCVNPSHLEPVTRQVNCRRGMTGKHSQSRALSVAQDNEVAASPLSNRQLAPLYGCSREAIRTARLRAARRITSGP